MYKTATTVFSDRGNEIYSTRIVDNLLLNNGYTEREYSLQSRKIRKENKKDNNHVTISQT
jgi:hypothetical protein